MTSELELFASVKLMAWYLVRPVKLTLHDRSYAHECVSAAGQPGYQDSGTVACP